MKLNSISRHDLDGLCNTADLLVEPGRRVLAVIRDSLPGAVTQEAQVRELTGLGHVVHLSRVNQRSRKRKGYWADAWLGDTEPIENTPPHTHTHTHTQTLRTTHHAHSLEVPLQPFVAVSTGEPLPLVRHEVLPWNKRKKEQGNNWSTLQGSFMKIS